ncbi:Serine/arginine repetitive matrix protein 2, partial [Trichinella papuae]
LALQYTCVIQYEKLNQVQAKDTVFIWKFICAVQFVIFACIMYNGIGLQTARGSGTSGYVQKNLAHVVVSKDKQLYRNEDDIKRMESKVTRKPNKELILHERKRKIELKCLEMQDLMTEQNYPEEEIQEKVDKYRALLRKKLEEEGDVDDDEVANEKRVKDSHIMAEMMQEKNDRIRRALNIKKDHVSGAAFKFNEKKAEMAELASLNKNLLQRPVAEVEKKEEADEETSETSSASSSSSSSSEDSDSSTDSSDSDEESSSSTSTVSSDSSREVKQKTSKRVFREEPSRRDGKRRRRESSDRERSSRKRRSPSPRNVSTKQRDSSSKISKSKDSESYRKRRAEKNDDDHLSKERRKETKSRNDSKKRRHKSELSRRSTSSSPRARRHHSKHDERNGNRKSKEEHRKERKHK